MKEFLSPAIFKIISHVAGKEKIQTYVIGGFVRDAILKRGPDKMDIDIVVLGNGIDMARKIAFEIDPKIKVSVFKNFGTAMFRYEGQDIEFVGARKESYRKDSRKPIVENGSLEDDQKRRDFTINAMAIRLDSENFGEFIDPFSGKSDLKKKLLRTPLDPEKTFSDDPLRMIRAIRFATELNFSIEEQTLKSISNNCDRIKIVSQERIILEINKIILSRKPSVGFLLLEETGLLNTIFPELDQLKGVETENGKQHKDNFLHTLEVLDKISKNTKSLYLRWAALLHDIAKPKTKKFIKGQGWTFHGHEFFGAKMVPHIFRTLKLPLNEKMKYVQKMVLLHLRPIVLSQDIVSDSAVRRLLYDAGDDVDDLMTLCEADITSKNDSKVQKYLANFKIVRQKLKDLEARDKIRNFQPPISGDVIIRTFNMKPSSLIGEIKSAIKEAILDGVIGNNYEEAYKFMIEKARELGLEPDQNS